MTAILIGATGLTGQDLLKQLLNSDQFKHVIAIVRSKLKLESTVKASGTTASKLSILEFDFKNWDRLLVEVQKHSPADAVGFCCLGTTIKVAGSKEAFYRIDVEAPFQFAKMMDQLRASHFIAISSQGASEKSSAFYLKCKGEMERRCAEVFSRRCVFVRPGLLLGYRQEHRPAEKLFAKISNSVPFIFSGPLKKFKPIQARQVAKAMLQLSKTVATFPRIQHIENIDLVAFI